MSSRLKIKPPPEEKLYNFTSFSSALPGNCKTKKARDFTL